jgi:hypothetical protein
MRRRDCLTASVVAAASALQVAQPVRASGANPLAGESLFADVERYCAFGEQRTGGLAHRQTTAWLEQRLQSTGCTTQTQPLQLNRYEPAEALLRTEQGDIAGWPLWHPAPGPHFVRGPLRSSAGGGIRVLRLTADPRASVFPGSEHRALMQNAATGGAQAVVAITPHDSGEVVALNALGGEMNWPLPVLCVGAAYGSRLQALETQGAWAELRLNGGLEPRAEAHNVVGRRSGAGRSIIVSTPSSGWFRCGGERGPGIAIWLALAARASAHAPWQSPLCFVATTGHELGALGMRQFLKEGAPPPAQVKAWLHLGAGFAVWAARPRPVGMEALGQVNPRRGMSAPADMAELLQTSFRDVDSFPVVTDRRIGETQLLAREGYRAFGPVGQSDWHHLRSDGPQATGPALLAPVAAALWSALVALDAQA